MCEEVGDYEGVREDLERMLPGASANGAFAMALVQREQEFAADCKRSEACAEGPGRSCTRAVSACRAVVRAQGWRPTVPGQRLGASVGGSGCAVLACIYCASRHLPGNSEVGGLWLTENIGFSHCLCAHAVQGQVSDRSVLLALQQHRVSKRSKGCCCACQGSVPCAASVRFRVWP